MRNILLLLVLISLLSGASLPPASPVMAQAVSNGAVEVYAQRDWPGYEPGVARLSFVNSVTGDTTTTDARGEGFTVLGGYVLYRQPETGIVYRAWPDGRTEPHPFIQPAAQTEAVAWVVSPDGQWVAWTLTDVTADGQLITSTSLARADGSDWRVVYTDGPDTFWRVVPLALTDAQVLFFDRQPQGVAGFFFYPQYASVYRLDAALDGAQPSLLPFEPNCFCGAGVSADGRYFARLERLTDDGGYDLRVWDLNTDLDAFVPSLPARYQLAGSVLVAPDGERVVYSLANNLTLDSAGTGSERFMLALAEVGAGEQQTLLFNPLLVPLLPVQWTEDGRGVLLTNPRQDGTWKLLLETGEVRRIAEATYIGLLRPA